MTNRSRAAVSVLLAVLAVLAPIAGVATLAAPAAAAPSGMTTLPNENISEDAPADANLGISASELEGGVLASKHQDSLEVILTTADHATTVMDSDSAVVEGDGMTIVLRDNTYSEGRRVAIDAAELREALGYKPTALYGTHESGEQWVASASYEDGYLVFDVPHFSSNTVTFSGTVNITSTPASDGAQLSYDINDLDSATDPNVTFTGSTHSEWDNQSWTGLSDGASKSISVAGNLDPAGGSSGGEPEVVFTGIKGSHNPLSDEGDGAVDADPSLVGDDSSNNRFNTSIEFTPSESFTVTKLTVPIAAANNDGYSIDADIYMSSGEADSTWEEGTKIYDAWQPSYSTGTVTLTLDSTFTVSSGSTYEVEFITQNTDSDGGLDTLDLDIDSSASTTKYIQETDSVFDNSYYANITLESNKTEDPAIDIDGDGTDEASVTGTLSDGATSTKEIDSLTTDDSTLNVSLTDGSVDVALNYKERTQTVDPSIEVNDNNWVNHTGSLSDGSSTSYTGNSNWLTSGVNYINVSAGDGSLAADAPTPEVDLDYSHDSQDDITTTFTDEQWTNRYNISKTYASDRSSASMDLTYDEDVISHRVLEYRINASGGWSSVPASDYSLSGNDLSVDVDALTGGTVDSGTEVEVRANASQVETNNIAITVTDASLPNEDLNTKFSVDSESSNSFIGVGPTVKGDRIHYADSSGYTTKEYSIVYENGSQHVYLPNIEAGDSATLSTIPVSVSVGSDSGDVKLSVTDSSQSNPEFDIEPGPGGSGDSVEYTYYNTKSDEKYSLRSITNELIRDTKTANSPVTLADDDSDELLEILLADSDGGDSSGGGGGGGGAIIQSTDAGPLTQLLNSSLLQVVLVILGVLAVLWLRGRGDESGGGGGGMSASLSDLPWTIVLGLLAIVGIGAFALNPTAGPQALIILFGGAGSIFFGWQWLQTDSRRSLGLALASAGGVVLLVGPVGGFVEGLLTGAGEAAAGLGEAISALTAPLTLATIAGIIGGAWLGLRYLRTRDRTTGLVFAGVVLGVFALLGVSPAGFLTDSVTTIAVTVLLVGGVFVGLRQLGVFSWPAFGILAAFAFVLGAEAVSPGAIIPNIGDALGTVLPILLIGGGYLVYQWIQARQAPDEEVNLTIDAGRGGD